MRLYPLAFRVFCVLTALVFAGCASSTDVSSHESFRASVGQPVALIRPMLLIRHSGYYFGGSDDVMSRRRVRYGLTEPGTYSAPHVFSALPTGHRVIIDVVQEETCFDAYQTVVYGRTIFPPTGKEVSFAYVRAPIMYSMAEPLPWKAPSNSR